MEQTVRDVVPFLDVDLVSRGEIIDERRRDNMQRSEALWVIVYRVAVLGRSSSAARPAVAVVDDVAVIVSELDRFDTRPHVPTHAGSRPRFSMPREVGNGIPSLRRRAVALACGLTARADRLTDLAPRQPLLARGTHSVCELTFGGVAPPGGELDHHHGRDRGILVAGLRVVVLKRIRELVRGVT